MKRNNHSLLRAVVFCLAFAVIFLVTAFAARMPGDLDNDGRITAADARIVLRISARLEKLEDYYTPEELAEYGLNGDTPTDPVDVNFEVEFAIADGGYFIGGESTAVITVTADANLTSAKLEVLDAADTTVYKTTVSDLKKDTPVSVEWDGKNDSGEFVSSGDYTVSVGYGEQTAKAEGLTFTAENYFSDGNGSEANPFLISSKEDIENIIRYPRAYFKQVKDIDYDYTIAKSMFSEDMPFNGVYDGNNNKISNLVTEDALFKYIGMDGILENMNFENSSFAGFAGITNINQGKIKNCTIEGLLTKNTSSTARENVGLVTRVNYGYITGCNVKGSVSGTISYVPYSGIGSSGYFGGIAGTNHGKIIDCIADVNVTGTAGSS